MLLLALHAAQDEDREKVSGQLLDFGSGLPSDWAAPTYASGKEEEEESLAGLRARWGELSRFWEPEREGARTAAGQRSTPHPRTERVSSPAQ